MGIDTHTHDSEKSENIKMAQVVVSLQDVLARVLTNDPNSPPEGLLKYFESDLVRTCLEQLVASIPEAVKTLPLEQYGLGAMLLLFSMTQKPDIPLVLTPLSQQFGELAERLLLQIPKTVVDQYPQAFVAICTTFTNVCTLAGKSICAIAPLRSACAKLQLGPYHITTAHPLLLQVCISSKCYNAALPYVTTDLYEVDPAKLRVTTEAILTYFYYAGVVCVALKSSFLRRALYFFRMAFAVPADALSAIVLASYKRFVLASLLLDGKADESPRHVSPMVLRQLKSRTLAYQELMSAFRAKEHAKLLEVLNKHASTYQDDGVLGLAKQVVAHLNRQNVRGLTQTYLTISFDGIATAAKLPSAEAAHSFVISMIQKGLIEACVDQQQGIVAFRTRSKHQHPHSSSSASAIPAQLNHASLQAALDRIHGLVSTIERTHKDMQVDPAFVARTLSVAERKAATNPTTGAKAQGEDDADDAGGMAVDYENATNTTG
eukprot:c9424_g1_i1.p1 GENE.c9424_g1_i1~~c9424_g1_i1.p1  ORF type:complete len:490 (-),score=152.00 c9424_g1_i1:153-1622(-)